MANINELDRFDDNVYLIDEQDSVLGGENGISNKQAKALANRTRWLKNVYQTLSESLSALDSQVSSLSTSLTNYIDSGISSLSSQISNLSNSLTDFISNTFNPFVNSNNVRIENLIFTILKPEQNAMILQGVSFEVENNRIYEGYIYWNKKIFYVPTQTVQGTPSENICLNIDGENLIASFYSGSLPEGSLAFQNLLIYIRKSETQESKAIHTEILNIGYWNMNCSSEGEAIKQVSFTNTNKIITIRVLIRTDADSDSNVQRISFESNMTGHIGGAISLSNNTINLVASLNSIFDNENYSSSSINRGFIYIQYTD